MATVQKNPTMPCGRCHAQSAHLYEIFKDGWHPLSVCAKCIVGEFIPVFRPSIKRWNFGEVLAFRGDPTDIKFELSFGIEPGTEWVELASKPFEAYVLSHHKMVAIILGASRQQSQESHEAVKRSTETPSNGTLAFRSRRHLDNRRPIRPPKKPSVLTMKINCPRTPIQTSVFRSVLFDSPVHSAAACLSDHTTPIIGNGLNANLTDHTTPIIGNGLNAKAQRLSPSESLLSRNWTTEEDRLLLQSTLRNPPPFKWAKNAQNLGDRSVKQCKERYYNHLQPKLDITDWSPVEDALVYYLHSSLGAKWSLIADLIPGRTDKNVKNRYHQIYSRLEQQISKLDPKMLATASSTKILVMERLTNYKASEQSPTTQVLKLVVHSLRSRMRLQPIQYRFQFNLVDPDNDDNDDTTCTRCGLLIPSLQTGSQVCTKTGWCSSCVSAPSYLSADILRIVHSEIKVANEYRRYFLPKDQSDSKETKLP